MTSNESAPCHPFSLAAAQCGCPHKKQIEIENLAGKLQTLPDGNPRRLSWLCMRDKVLSPAEVDNICQVTLLSPPASGPLRLLAIDASELIADRYQIIEWLGKGGCGAVLRCRDIETSTDVALKVCLSEADSDKRSKRFRRELELALDVVSPYFVRSYAVGKDPSHLVMEYVCGETMADVCLRGAMHERLVCCIGIELARALKALLSSRHRVFHRDVKPGNIMLDVNRRILLMDLGFGKPADSDLTQITESHEVFGTYYYMSPEQALGRSTEWSTDVFSLGATLYRLVSGTQPFGETPQDALDNLRHHAKPRDAGLGEVTDELREAIGRMLRRAPGDRYESYDGLIEALSRARDKLAAAEAERVALNLPNGWEAKRDQGWCHTAQGGGHSKEFRYFTNRLGMRFAYVPEGDFHMGCMSEKEDFLGVSRLHRARVGAFLLGSFPVTKEVYANVMGDGAQVDADKAKSPVVGVSWRDAMEFCAKLRQMDGVGYRLPSETEWEYACRAGADTSYSFGEAVRHELANFARKEDEGTTEQGAYNPNRWGLCDMHGNVAEWTASTYHGYPLPRDGSAEKPNPEFSRIIRGGSWADVARHLASWSRQWKRPDWANDRTGFRVVAVLP